MKYMVEIELTEQQAKLAAENSLERVLNSVISLKRGEWQEDLEELKPLASLMWYAMAGAVIAKAWATPTSTRT